MATFTSVAITEEHKEMLKRNQDKIRNFYKLQGELELL